MVTTETLKEAVIRIYFSENHKDPHQVFADWRGISRNDAKRVAYQQLYSITFFKGLINAHTTYRR